MDNIIMMMMIIINTFCHYQAIYHYVRMRRTWRVLPSSSSFTSIKTWSNHSVTLGGKNSRCNWHDARRECVCAHLISIKCYSGTVIPVWPLRFIKATQQQQFMMGHLSQLHTERSPHPSSSISQCMASPLRMSLPYLQAEWQHDRINHNVSSSFLPSNNNYYWSQAWTVQFPLSLSYATAVHDDDFIQQGFALIMKIPTPQFIIITIIIYIYEELLKDHLSQDSVFLAKV